MDDVELLQFIARAPMRAVRWAAIAARVPNAARTLSRLMRKGALTRLATGVYIAPPGGADGRRWQPPLEVAALALGTARVGQRKVVLVGVGAARFWGAIPRALAETTIAAPVRGRRPVVLDTGGTVHFVQRDIDRLDAVLESTELGEALVATPAQTLYDLLADRGGTPLSREIADGARNLLPRVSRNELAQIAAGVQRVPAGVTAMLNEWSGSE